MLTSPQRRLLIEADIDKRRLERASVHGDEGTQSKELVMKMRNGDLTQGQVKLLSYLSYKPAQLLIPTEAPEDLKSFVRGLELWGKETLVKAAVVSARSVLHVFEEARPDDRLRKALEAAEDASFETVDASAANSAAVASSIAWTAAVNAGAATVTAAASWAAWASAINTSVSAAAAAAHSADASTYFAARADPSLNIRGIIEKELIDWVLNEH